MDRSRISYRSALTQGQGFEAPPHGQQPDTLHTLKILHAIGHQSPGDLHPFQKVEGETLPPGFFRNAAGFLVRRATSFTVLGEDLATLDREIRFLKDHVIIARSMDGDLSTAKELT